MSQVVYLVESYSYEEQCWHSHDCYCRIADAIAACVDIDVENGGDAAEPGGDARIVRMRRERPLVTAQTVHYHLACLFDHARKPQENL